MADEALNATLGALLLELQSSCDALIITGSDRRVRLCSARAVEMLAIPADVVERGDADELWRWLMEHAVDPAAVEEGARKAARDGKVHTDELALHDGRVLERSISHRELGGGWQRLILLRDVTDRRRAERELEARHAQQAAVAAMGQRAMRDAPLSELLEEAVRVIPRTLDVDLCAVRRVDPRGLLLVAGHGFAPGQVGAHVLPVDPRAQPSPAMLIDDAHTDARVPPAVRAGLPQGIQAVIKVNIDLHDGPWGILSVGGRKGQRFSADDTHFLEAMANVLASAIERHRSMEALRTSAASFRSLIERSPDAIVVHDGERVLYANAAAVSVYGYANAQQMMGLTATDLFHPEEQAVLEHRVRIMHETGSPPPVHEVRVRRPDGQRVPLELRSMPVLFEGRRAYVSVGRDLSERRKLESQLHLADRMSSVGTLAAGAAHELNNPLAWVLGNLSFAREQLESVQRRPEQGAAAIPEVVQALREAETGAERMRLIVGDLKTFARGDELTLSEVDVNEVLRSSINIAANELRHRARLVLDLRAVPRVRANEAKLGQVFLNLLVNAAQAIERGGGAENEVRVSTGVHESFTVVEVRDSGVGISQDVARRMFDPFFTTRPVGGVGTGLGLSICHNLVSSFGGRIEVESEPGKGALFRVLLPSLAQEEPRPAAAPAFGKPAAPGPLQGARILVVDDEPMVGLSIHRVLRADYEVVVAGGAHEALTRLRGGERFEAILCDLLMPEMTGMDLYAALAALEPAQARRMLFMTGGAFTEAAERFLHGEHVRHLLKPFSQQALRSALQEISANADSASASR